jgi:hypothetical protein
MQTCLRYQCVAGTDPPRLHAQSRLAMLPFSVDGTVPHSSHGHLFRLAALDLGAWSKVPSPCMCTHTIISTITSMEDSSDTVHEYYVNITYYSILFVRVVQTHWP